MAFFELLAGGEAGGSRSIVSWIVIIFLFMFVMPKLYFYQIFAKIETSAKKLEDISTESRKQVIRQAVKHGKRREDIKNTIDRFVEFFMVSPVNLDPYGILKKFEHLIDRTEERFKEVAHEIVPEADSEQTMDFYMGLQAAVVIHTIAKVVRHYVEMSRKFKNLQFAMILQMQLPMIEEIVQAEQKGLKAFIKGEAIGDGIGPLVVANHLDKPGKEITPEALASTVDFHGRKVTFIKAKGPGGRLGKIGDAVRVSAKKGKIAKIITVDAAAKLEGEKSGSLAEGVGVAMGGVGVQRAKIEEVALQLGVPADAIAIKMSQAEAISPMPLEVIKALDGANALLKEKIESVKKGSHIIVIGVGNTCGVPNDKKNINDVVKKITKRAKKAKQEEEAKKAKGWFKKEKKTNIGEESLMFFAKQFGLAGGM